MRIAALVPRTSTLLGVGTGLVVLGGIFAGVANQIGPLLETSLDPILLTRVGDGVEMPAPWKGQTLPPPSWDGRQACWWMALYKRRNNHPVSLSIKVRTKSYGDVPIQASMRTPDRQRLWLRDHPVGSIWMNAYCTDVTADLLPPTNDLTVVSAITYASRSPLWSTAVQPLAPVHIPITTSN